MTTDKATTRRVLLASLIGSAIEWFDYFLYGTVAALVFSELYFPSDDPAQRQPMKAQLRRRASSVRHALHPFVGS